MYIDFVQVYTVDGQVDPGTVDVIVFVGAVKKHDGALVPSFISRLDVS